MWANKLLRLAATIKYPSTSPCNKELSHPYLSIQYLHAHFHIQKKNHYTCRGIHQFSTRMNMMKNNLKTVTTNQSMY